MEGLRGSGRDLGGQLKGYRSHSIRSEAERKASKDSQTQVSSGPLTSPTSILGATSHWVIPGVSSPPAQSNVVGPYGLCDCLEPEASPPSKESSLRPCVPKDPPPNPHTHIDLGLRLRPQVIVQGR